MNMTAFMGKEQDISIEDHKTAPVDPAKLQEKRKTIKRNPNAPILPPIAELIL